MTYGQSRLDFFTIEIYYTGVYKPRLKRIIDLLLALSGLPFVVCILLPFCFVSFFVYRGKIFFSQPRPGKDEVVFWILKLRTMFDGEGLSDAQRLNNWGKFLRRSSLDELPQIINIIKGEMSFVGPRPLLIEYLEHYLPEQRRRHEVLPGITGLSQIKGRNNLSWQSKFEYDTLYVDNVSFLLDLRILLDTIRVVFSGKDVTQQGEATFERFTGNPPDYKFVTRTLADILD